MTSPGPSSSVFPGVPVLDELELVRLGLLAQGDANVPPGPVTVVDAEGVPVAEVGADGALTWLSARSPRPFERWHLGDDVAVESPLTLVDDWAALAAIPEDTRTLVALASVDGDDNQHDLDLVRAARRAADDRGYVFRIAPIGSAAPGRAQLTQLLRTALAADHDTVHDLTSPSERSAYQGRGVVILFSGLSGSGKSTIARALRDHLVEEESRTVSLLDGDVVRRHLSAGLSFSPADRETNIRRIGWVAAEIARHGGTAIASPIAPFESTRQDVRRMVEGRGGRFVLVHVATPLEECERRDRKGLYARARAGEIPDFTGISSPYETPTDATLTLDTTGQDVEPLVEQLLDVLRLHATSDNQPNHH